MDGLPLGAPISLDVTGPDVTATVVDGSLHELFIRQQFFHIDDRDRLAGAGYERYRGGFLKVAEVAREEFVARVNSLSDADFETVDWQAVRNLS